MVTHLRRAVLELVSNAVRHGAAGTVTIDVSSTPSTLAVSVADDGAGMEPSSVKSRGGLANVRARAAELGGRVVVEPVRSGACVRIELPRVSRPRERRAPAA